MTASKKLLLILAPVLGLGLSPLHAAPLLLDFGPTTPNDFNNDLGINNNINSPYHTVSGGTESTWNILGTADSSSLNWGDGNAATSVSVNLGRTSNNDIIDFANQPGTSHVLGDRIKTGVFDGNSVGKDAIFTGTSGQKDTIGLKITGLALNTYDIYMVGLNTNIVPNGGGNEALPQNMGALATTDVGTLDITGLSTTNVHNYRDITEPDTSSWVEGTNYAHFQVTLTADNPVLTLFTHGDDNRPFLNAVQIQAIPEPGTLVLLGIALGSMLLFRRR